MRSVSFREGIYYKHFLATGTKTLFFSVFFFGVGGVGGGGWWPSKLKAISLHCTPASANWNILRLNFVKILVPVKLSKCHPEIESQAAEGVGSQQNHTKS